MLAIKPNPSGSIDETVDVTDRRRPGRRAAALTSLLPLLRQAGSSELTALDASLAAREQDELQAGRGILVAATVSLPLWWAIGWALRQMLG